MKQRKETILTAQTDAAQSTPFFVDADEVVTLMCTATLAGVETASVQYSVDDGANWVDYLDGAAVDLTVDKNAIRLYGPCFYRVDKDATAGATGLVIQR